MLGVDKGKEIEYIRVVLFRNTTRGRMSERFTEGLKRFGLTGVEASIYEALLEKGAMTGYEISKETGISRSNVYSSVNSLVEKGAAYISEGEAAKYTPVEIKTFTENCLRSLKAEAESLVENAPKPLEKSEGYITINGERHVKDKIHEMLSKTNLRVYLMAEDALISEYEEELSLLINKGKKIVLLSESKDVKGALNYHTKPEKGQIRLITDSQFVLTGSVETCLYSGQQNLVAVMKEALKNRIDLIKIENEDK